jgi:hypothetical protein
LAMVRANFTYLSRKIGFSLLFGMPATLGAALGAANIK